MSDLFSLSHRFSRRPLYYITSDSLCQEVFQSFSNFFHARLACLSCVRCRLSATFILYHFQFALSRGFLNFFQFFLPLLPLAFCDAVSSTAPLLYHIPPLLSIPFSPHSAVSAFATKNGVRPLSFYTVLHDSIPKQLNDNLLFSHSFIFKIHYSAVQPKLTS